MKEPLVKHDLTVMGAARFMGVSPNTIRRWSDQGALPHSRTLGGHRRYSKAELAVVKNRDVENHHAA